MQMSEYLGNLLREWGASTTGGVPVALLAVASAVLAIATNARTATTVLESVTLFWFALSVPLAGFRVWRSQGQALHAEISSLRAEVGDYQAMIDAIKIPDFTDSALDEARIVEYDGHVGVLVRLRLVNRGSSSNVRGWSVSATSNGQMTAGKPGPIPLEVRRGVLKETKFVHDVMPNTFGEYVRLREYRCEMWATFDTLTIAADSLRIQFRDDTGRVYALMPTEAQSRQLEAERNAQTPFRSDFPPKQITATA